MLRSVSQIRLQFGDARVDLSTKSIDRLYPLGIALYLLSQGGAFEIGFINAICQSLDVRLRPLCVGG